MQSLHYTGIRYSRTSYEVVATLTKAVTTITCRSPSHACVKGQAPCVETAIHASAAPVLQTSSWKSRRAAKVSSALASDDRASPDPIYAPRTVEVDWFRRSNQRPLLSSQLTEHSVLSGFDTPISPAWARPCPPIEHPGLHC